VAGTAKVKLSFAAWKEAKISPATDDLKLVRPTKSDQ
jgi:hypothetical protein